MRTFILVTINETAKNVVSLYNVLSRALDSELKAIPLMSYFNMVWICPFYFPQKGAIYILLTIQAASKLENNKADTTT